MNLRQTRRTAFLGNWRRWLGRWLPGLLAMLYLLASAAAVQAQGLLYALRQVDSGENQIFGYAVNEMTGALTALAGFPVGTGGNGVSSRPCGQLAVDAANQRLYVLNDGSDTLSAFAINPATGALSALPFSPVNLGLGEWDTVAVHPAGSPLVIGDGISNRVLSFQITTTTALPAAGSPYTTDDTRTDTPSFSTVFSRNGDFVYTGGNHGTGFAGFSVNATTGVLTALAGSPFQPEGDNPIAYATDSAGRLFMATASVGQVRVFTTSAGLPSAVAATGVPAGLSSPVHGVVHPNGFYLIAERSGSRVSVYQISGSGAATNITVVTGSPFYAGGAATNLLALNRTGAFLFAANGASRNLTTFGVNPVTGALTALGTEPADTVGTSGQLTGLGYYATPPFIVSKTADTNDGVCDGDCSLREALTAANALPGADVIVFAPGVTGTINLTGALPNITDSLSIQGPGAKLLTVRRDTGGDYRIFTIPGGGLNIALSGLTISNGKLNERGGGIFSGSNLTLTDCAITGNETVGTVAGGGVYLDTANGVFTGCTFSGNTAGNQGGGIYFQGDDGHTLQLRNCTISGNTATSSGNLVNISRSGHSTLELTNCTVANNRSLNAANAGIRTISSGSGSVTFAHTFLRNTLVANNGQNFALASSNGLSELGLRGNNFDSDGSSGATNGVDGNQVGASNAALDALLAPLGDYGGPTQTHALLPGSPALNAGNNCVLTANGCRANDPPAGLTTDQRGIARQVGAGVDIGAFESQGFTIAKYGDNQTALPTTTFANPLAVTVSSNFNEPVAGGVLTFLAPASGASATFVGSPATLNNQGQASVIATANATAGSYQVTTNVNGLGSVVFNLTNQCPTINVGTPVSSGTIGLAYNSSVAATPAAPQGFKYQYSLANGTLLPAGLSLDANTGALTGTPTTLGNVSFDIKAELFNGAMTTGCAVTATRSLNITCVTNPVVTTNADSGAGSLRQAIAMSCPGSTITFANTVVSPITLTSGELLIDKDLTIGGPGANLLTVQRSTAPNTPDFRIFNISNVTATLDRLTIANGKVSENGGGINNAGILTITNSTISGNTASRSINGNNYGGGINSLNKLRLINCTISGNTASGSGYSNGGGINGGFITLINSTLSGNTASGGVYNQGGGIYSIAGVILINSTLSGNTASGGISNQGGGIFLRGQTTITNSTLFGNTASGGPSNEGGGIFLDSGPLNTQNTIIAGNSASSNGPDVVGVFTSQGHNLIGKEDGSSGFINGTNGDQVGSSANPLDPQLAPLGDYGGPTQTLKLLPGSPAIDKGAAANDPSNNQPLTTDQRGQARPYDIAAINNANGGNGSDIGAYEYNCATLTLAALPNGTAGVAYNQALNSNGGLAPYNVSQIGGTLPPGLSLTANSLSGTPATGGTFSFVLAVTDAYGCTGSQSYTLTVSCPVLTLLPTTLPNGVQGTAYNQTLTVNPNGTTYSYAVTVGALPPGLTLTPTGTLSGTPNAGGNYAFGVTVTGWGTCAKTQSYNLLITGTCSTITVNPASLSAATLGAAYTQSVSATGGTAPYSYSVSVGALPAGLTLNASTGEITGTPTASGTFAFTLRATGQGGCSGSRQYVLQVNCVPLTFTPATLTNGTRGVAYSQQLSVSPTSNATFSLLLGSLPPGFSLSSSGLLNGITTQAATYNFTVKAVAGTCQGTTPYTLSIGTGTAALALSGDYDGDGKADPAFWSVKDGTWRIVRSSDGQTRNERWGTTGDVTLLGDYDGDGKSDLAVFRPSDATFYVKRSSDGQFLVKPWGLSTDVPVPGDYDGDGRTDLAVFRPSEGTWYVLRSSDQQAQVTAWGAGYAPYYDLPVAGDYDGDGRTDLAVFRHGNGQWWIKRSHDGQAINKLWGLGTDVPVAADYDGDGQTDLAVWRPAEGNWYVWQSATQTARLLPWGMAGDQTRAGDYDGDGQADPAVWREARCYIWLSASRAARLVE